MSVSRFAVQVLNLELQQPTCIPGSIANGVRCVCQGASGGIHGTSDGIGQVCQRILGFCSMKGAANHTRSGSASQQQGARLHVRASTLIYEEIKFLA